MKKMIRASRKSIAAIAIAAAVFMTGFVFAQTGSVYASGGGHGGHGEYSGHDTHSGISASAASKHIGKSKALKIALKHAKLKRSQVHDVDVDKDYERGRWIYEVSFDRNSNNKEYNYDIKATNGKILKAPAKAKKAKKAKNISRAKALDIALKNAGATRSQIWDVDIEKDYEWGQWIYEINFNKGNYEYDYDIAVKGGKILNKQVEYDD